MDGLNRHRSHATARSSVGMTNLLRPALGEKTPFLHSFVKNPIFASIKPTTMVEIAGLEIPEWELSDKSLNFKSLNLESLNL